MSYIDIEARLRTALVTLILDEYSLLETIRLPLPASERVIASQLAWRLRTEYERTWDVDVEYNRVGHGNKPDSGSTSPVPESRPVDISIHHRGLSGPGDNLLVIELKTHGVAHLEAEVTRLDTIKRHYNYQHAVLVDLGMAENEDADGPPVLLNPAWLWLPGAKQMSPVFDGEQAKQLSHDGWHAHQIRNQMRQALQEDH
ncbi:MAG: hypothetical protein FWD29_07610 [Micrococcales bacterium]|nr:hypothetical protein [Micrococcales bacterium]